MVLVPFRVDEVIELGHSERMAFVTEFVHLYPVQEDKEVMGGSHL